MTDNKDNQESPKVQPEKESKNNQKHVKCLIELFDWLRIIFDLRSEHSENSSDYFALCSGKPTQY